MTPRERAEALYSRVCGRTCYPSAATLAIEEAIREAVEAEREACALLVDGVAHSEVWMTDRIRLNDLAHKIRDRKGA